MTYKTNRERAIDVINKILASIGTRELDYYKTISIISNEAVISKKLAAEILESFVEIGKLTEIRTLIAAGNPAEEEIKEVLSCSQ